MTKKKKNNQIDLKTKLLEVGNKLGLYLLSKLPIVSDILFSSLLSFSLMFLMLSLVLTLPVTLINTHILGISSTITNIEMISLFFYNGILALIFAIWTVIKDIREDNNNVPVKKKRKSRKKVVDTITDNDVNDEQKIEENK